MYKKITYIRNSKTEQDYAKEYLKNIKEFCAKHDFDLTIIDMGKMNRLKKFAIKVRYRGLDKVPQVRYAGNTLFGGISKLGLKEFIAWTQTDWHDNPLGDGGRYIKSKE